MITLPTVAAVCAFLVVRYRGYGIIASILLGWVILYAVYNIWPAPQTEWDEDREEIFATAPVITGIWSMLVLGAVELWCWIRHKGARA